MLIKLENKTRPCAELQTHYTGVSESFGCLTQYELVNTNQPNMYMSNCIELETCQYLLLKLFSYSTILTCLSFSQVKFLTEIECEKSRLQFETRYLNRMKDYMGGFIHGAC